MRQYLDIIRQLNERAANDNESRVRELVQAAKDLRKRFVTSETSMEAEKPFLGHFKSQFEVEALTKAWALFVGDRNPEDPMIVMAFNDILELEGYQGPMAYC